MKKIFVILLLFIVFTSNGQDVLMEGAKNKKVQLGINFSPDISYRTLKINEESLLTQSIADYRNKTEKAKLSYTAGVSICYKYSKRMSVEAGLQFANKGYIQKIDMDYKTVNPASYFSTFEDLKYREKFYYIEIPLKANFFMGTNRTRFIASAGVSGNLFLKSVEVVTYTYSDVKHKDRNNVDYNFNPIDITPFVSAGIDYKLTDKLNIRITPTFRYSLLDIIDGPLTAQLWSAGINFGSYIGF